MKRIHIFKAGEQISSSGYTKTFSEEDLESMVSSFDLSVHEPPIRVGHEDNDKVPAYGWVKSVYREGENLYADVDFTSEMEEMISNGNYRKVSASFYPPESAVNPKKGHYTLKHIAMLGGVAPAVKGLEGILFSEGEDETIMAEIEFECSGEGERKKKKKKSKPQPKEVLPEEEEEVLPAEEEGVLPEEEEEEFKEPVLPEEEEVLPAEEEEEEFKESVPARVVVKEVLPEEEEEEEEEVLPQAQEDYKELLAQIVELRASEERAKSELNRVLRERRREVLTTQVEHLYHEGQMTEGTFPKEELLEFVVGLEEGTLDFSEGKTASDMVIGILSRIPAPVNFSELVTEAEAPVVEEEFQDFSEKVEKYAQEHNTTFEQALRALAN